jgi:hypothetical protein
VTHVKTEKASGQICENRADSTKGIYIGYDSGNCIHIYQGVLSFEYSRMHDNIRMEIPSATTRSIVQQLGMSYFTWKLRLLGDCRQAFFATDVQAAAGNQYAMTSNNLSNKIEYFKVVMPIQDEAGTPRTRTYTITNGYALRNHAVIGEGRDTEYEYEGDAEYISYSDA